MAGGIWVPVNAQMKGFVAAAVKEASKAGLTAGEAFDKEFGSKTDNTATAVAKKLESASRAVQRARADEAKAATNLKTAEAQLDTLRAGGASASKVIEAENRVAAARANVEDAAQRLSRGEADLEALRSGGEQTNLKVARAEDAVSKARIAATTATGDVKAKEQAVKEAREAAEKAAAKVADAEANLKDTRSKFAGDSKEVAKAEKELETARNGAMKASEQVAKAEGKSREAHVKAQNAAESLESKERNLKAAHDDLAASAGNVDEEHNQLAGTFDGMNGKLLDIGKKAAGAAAGYFAFDTVKNVVTEVALGFDDMYDTIRIGTGASGEAFEDLQESAVSLMDTVPAMDGGFQQVGTTLADLNTRLGVTGEPLEELASQFVHLSNMGIDADINTITAAMQGFGTEAKDMPGVMDELFQVSQATGMGMTELAKGIQENGPALREFGFGITDSAALLGTLDKAGLNGEQTLGYLKKALSSFSKEGLNAKDALADTIYSIEEMVKAGDYAGASMKAQDIFGVRGATDFVAAVQSGTFEVENFAEAAGVTDDTISDLAWETYDAAEKFQLFKQQAMLSLEPVGDWFMNMLPKAIDVGSAAFRGVQDAFNSYVMPVVDAIRGGFTQAFEDNKEVFVQFKDDIIGAFSSVRDFLSGSGMSEGVEQFASVVGEVVSDVVNNVGKLLKFIQDNGTWLGPLAASVGAFAGTVGALNAAMQGIEAVKAAGGIMQFMKSAQLASNITKVWTGIQVAFNTVMALNPIVLIVGAIAALTAGAVVFFTKTETGRQAWSAFMEFLPNAWEAVKGAFASGAEAVSNAVQSIVNWFVGLKDQAAANFQLVIDTVTGFWQNHIAPLPGYVGDAVNGVIGWFTGLADSARAKFQEAVDAVSNFWNNHIAPLPGQVAGAVTGVLQSIGELPGKVGQLFADAGSWLVNAGKNILQGLWNGMQEKWNSLKNWLSNTLSFSNIGSLIGLSSGGITAHADGSISRYAAGGENHVAQIARAGEWRVWAEPETGGEAYIPLADSKRARSTDILATVADRFGMTLVANDTGEIVNASGRDLSPQHVTAFADGGVVSGDDLLALVNGQGASQPLHDAPYVFGGSNWGDCSATVSAVAAKAVGITPFPRKFSTADEAQWLLSHGFKRGLGDLNALNIGMRDGGPGGGHTSGTLPGGTNFEMGGAASRGSVGPRAAGANDSYYNEFFHLPIEQPPHFDDVELDDLAEADLGADTPPVSAPAAAASPSATPAPSAQAESAGGRSLPSSNSISGVLGEVVTGHVADVLGVFGIADELPSFITAARDLYEENKGKRPSPTSKAKTSAETAQEQLDVQLYDQGGMLPSGALALNMSGRPEPVLTDEQWKQLRGIADGFRDGINGQAVGNAVSSGIKMATSAGVAPMAAMAEQYMPGAGAAVSNVAGMGTDYAAWYAGEVAGGWTDAFIQFGEQMLGSTIMEPILANAIPATTSVKPVVSQEAGMQPQSQQQQQSAPSTVINVSNVAEAIDARRHQEARELAGFAPTRI